MRALVVLPLLLCAAVCVDQVNSGEVNAVKLCGREFLRAVVYTCGGSRWRRFLTDSDMDGKTSFLLKTPDMLYIVVRNVVFLPFKMFSYKFAFFRTYYNNMCI